MKLKIGKIFQSRIDSSYEVNISDEEELITRTSVESCSVKFRHCRVEKAQDSMGIRQRRAGLQPAVTAQLKKKPSLSQCSTPQTAINLPVNLYDYIFDVPQGEDAIKSTEKVNTRGVRRGARDSGALHVRACVS